MKSKIHYPENSSGFIAQRFINNTQRSIFLTGKAGTGKTTFLRNIVADTFKNTIIVAPTGIAAINAGGVTIHSLFQLPFGPFVPENIRTSAENSHLRVHTPGTLIRELQLNKYKRKMLQELELLIIDEVSMLRADVVDEIDTVLKSIRRNPYQPFGGVQVLFIGDLLQLPPVVKQDEWQILKNHYSGIFFFHAHVLRDHPPLYIELEKIYRQSDERFIALLNNLRNNQVTPEDAELLNRYYRPDHSSTADRHYIQLTTHNHKADVINRDALSGLPGRSYSFEAEITDEFAESAFPVDKTLVLKKNAQVMFVKNDPSGEQKFFNGKIGRISFIDEERIEVSFDEEKRTVNVERYQWENIRYTMNEASGTIEEKKIGTFTQFPLRLAWAITVHKSQGLTFSKAAIDIGDAFAPGQVYVALSRLTSLDGLILTSRIDINRLSQDKQVQEFSRNRSDSGQLNETLANEKKHYLESYITKCFQFNVLSGELRAHLESYSDEENRKVRSKHFPWAEQLVQSFEPTRDFADKFVSQVKELMKNDSVNLQVVLYERVLSAKKYFAPLLSDLSKNIREKIDEVKDEKRVKQFMADLGELDDLINQQLQRIGKTVTLVHALLHDQKLQKEEFHGTAAKEHPSGSVQESATSAVKPEKTNSRKEKKVKVDTKAVSYELFRSGNSISEIAENRKMVFSTIASHLAFYVEKGLIDVSEFMPAEKAERIIAASAELNTSLLTPIKQSLGEDYSYSDVRFAMAAKTFTEQLKK